MDRGYSGRASEVGDLSQLVASVGSPQVVVLGDLILDRYTWGDAERVSQEAPVLVLRTGQSEQRAGGAASVAVMLRGLGARVELVTALGDDVAGCDARSLLGSAGVGIDAVLTDPGRPTTLKERFMGRAEHRHAHQILRVDHEARFPLSPAVEVRLADRLAGLIAAADAVVVSDYAKGVCTPGLLSRAIDLARLAGIPILVDPGKGVDYERYRGATCLTPNRHEAREADGAEIGCPEAAVAAGHRLCRRYELDSIVVTLDRDGMALARRDGRGGVFPTRERRVYDITGAGDMVLSVLAVCLAAGADYAEAVALANVAGGLEVEAIGVVPVTWAEVLADLGTGRFGVGKRLTLPALRAALDVRRAAGQRVAFTNGCFDLLHPGHLQTLRNAAALADCLVVGLNDDTGVRRLKGMDRPIIPEDERAALLAGLESVDYVCLFGDDTPEAIIRAIRPDVLVKGDSYAPGTIAGGGFVEGYGGRVVFVPVVGGWSTSSLIRRIRRHEAPLH